MTQEEKQLLLKDLCARLPYGVKCQTKNGIGTLISIECSFGENLVYVDFGHSEAEEYDLNNGDTVKPYLRPMSSMTKEEFDEYMHFTKHSWEGIDKEEDDYYVKVKDRDVYFDWLLEHHFDYRYRCLIEKGLALEAPEGMY